MRGVVVGVRDAGRGFRFLMGAPRLWWWVAAPAIITLVLIVAVVWAALTISAPLIAFLVSWSPDWLAGVLGGLVRLVVMGGLSVVGFLVYVSLSGLVAGPFCELLSEAIEERVTGVAPPGFSLGSFLHGAFLGVAHAARRLLVQLLSLGVVLAVGAFIPVVGPVAAILLGATFAASTAAFDCYDSVFGRRLWRYRQKKEYLRAHRGRTLGLGAVVASLMLIPFANLVALGIGSAGATLAMLDER